MKFQPVMSVFLILALCVYSARGDDEAAFRRDYAKAFEKMQKTYSQMIVTGVRTQYDESDVFESKADSTIYVSGDKSMWIATRKETARADDPLPVGTYMVGGGSPDLYFGGIKRPGAKDFEISEYGPLKKEEHRTVSAHLMRAGYAAYAPYQVLDATIADLLDGVWGYKLKSVAETKHDGKDTVTTVFEMRDEDGRTASAEIIFERESLLILQYTITFSGQSTSCGRVVYEDNTMPRKVKSVEAWEGRVGDETLIRNRMEFDVASIKFENPPAEIFTPAGVGLKEVPAIGK